MHPVFPRGSNSVGIPAALNELLHSSDRLLGEHVKQQPHHSAEQDDGDGDRHLSRWWTRRKLRSLDTRGQLASTLRRLNGAGLDDERPHRLRVAVVLKLQI